MSRMSAARIVARRMGRASGEMVRTLRAASSWPVFSHTSHSMVLGLVRQGVSPGLVVDVGANRGQFAVAALELIPSSRVVSFEPLPNTTEALGKLERHYGDRFVHRAIGLGARSSTERLIVNRHSQASSMLELADAHRRAFPDVTPIGSVEVRVERLDAQFTPAEIPANSMLKIDVQGFEWDVLEGAGTLLDAFEHLVIEASLRELYSGERTFMDLAHHLEHRGWSFARPVGSLVDPHTGECLQIDAYFTRRS